MAESFSWLRLGTRSRAPSAPLPANEVSRKTTRDSRSSDIQRPSPSCVSSHISTSEAKPDPLSIDDESPTFLIRSQDQVWYNPSLDQMVEALQVMLMTRGVLGSIPIEYNAYILHLIEGFAKAQKKIQETEAACQEMKQSLERNLEEFQLVTEDWLERESQYRAEVKRLEVLLSKSSEDGLAAVTLARTNSVIDRRGSEGDRFLSKLKVFRKSSANGSESPSTLLAAGQIQQIKFQASHANHSDKSGEVKDNEQVSIPKLLDADNDFLISEKFRRQDAVRKTLISSARDRRRYRRGPTLQPEVGDVKGGGDGARNPTTIPALPVIADERHHERLTAPSPANMHMKDGTSVGRPSAKTTHRLEDISRIPTADSAAYTDNAKHTDWVATHELPPLHEQDHSAFSFEPGDDMTSLPDASAEEQGHIDPQGSSQVPSQPTRGSLKGMAIKKFQHHADDTRGSSIGSSSGKEEPPPTQGGCATIRNPQGVVQSPPRKPMWALQECGNSRQTTAGSQPSQSSHIIDCPPTAPIAGQGNKQRQQAETDARIAATLALASLQNGSSQRG